MKIKKSRNPAAWRLFPILVFGLVMLGMPGTLLAQKATIEDIIVTNSESDVLIYFTVNDCFTEKILAGIHNGIPATFTFYVDLLRVRKALPDRKIASHTFSHTLTYDNLKEEYHIFLAEKNQEIVTKSLEEAKRIMAEANGFKTIRLERLQADRTYRLKVKAKLAKKTLPLYFHYLIPFSSLWDFETDWHERQFRY